MSVSKECWICYQTEKETEGEVWVHPCVCRGGLKWCHEKCLLGWIDEKQKGNSTRLVKCPQCLTPYAVILPSSGIHPSLPPPPPPSPFHLSLFSLSSPTSHRFFFFRALSEGRRGHPESRGSHLPVCGPVGDNVWWVHFVCHLWLLRGGPDDGAGGVRSPPGGFSQTGLASLCGTSPHSGNPGGLMFQGL